MHRYVYTLYVQYYVTYLTYLRTCNLCILVHSTIQVYNSSSFSTIVCPKYIHVYICTYVYTCMYLHKYVPWSKEAVAICVLFTYIRVHTLHTYVRTCIQYMCVYSVDVHMSWIVKCSKSHITYLYMSVYTLYIHTYVHVYIYTYIDVHTCTCTCIIILCIYIHRSGAEGEDG